MDFSDTLRRIVNHEELDRDEMEHIMDAMMSGQLTDAQIGGFLIGLRMKGETVTEISAAARIMRKHATRIDGGAGPIVDTCGTGGDGKHTFNISTAAAFIAAGAGVKIAKHGNRAASSRCGSADVLNELGVNLDASPETVSRCIQQVGIGFLFAPMLHKAMKHAIGPRRQLAVRTAFNMLGPLTNPAGATRQVIGVFVPNLTDFFARVLNELGSEKAMIVHGADGLDEITAAANSHVAELANGKVHSYEFDPRPYIGKYCTLADIAGGDAVENADIIRDIFAGEQGPHADVAKLNAAAAIYVADRADDFGEAWDVAGEAIRSGAAAAKLQALVRASHE